MQLRRNQCNSATVRSAHDKHLKYSTEIFNGEVEGHWWHMLSFLLIWLSRININSVIIQHHVILPHNCAKGQLGNLADRDRWISWRPFSFLILFSCLCIPHCNTKINSCLWNLKQLRYGLNAISKQAQSSLFRQSTMNKSSLDGSLRSSLGRRRARPILHNSPSCWCEKKHVTATDNNNILSEKPSCVQSVAL